MGEERLTNPFVPGHGAMPPCLAGRDAEQQELMRLLAYLQAGRGAPRAAVLTGPRGNGKTVLLRWFQHEIEATGQVDVVWRTSSDLPSLDALAQEELNAVIADTLDLHSTPEIVQARDRLALVGYVWKPPGAGSRWQPGIPSLMRYVRPR